MVTKLPKNNTSTWFPTASGQAYYKVVSGFGLPYSSNCFFEIVAIKKQERKKKNHSQKMHRRSRASSFLEVFSLNPLPYPVLLILAVIFIFLGLQWYVSYEEVVESAEESMGWILLAIPVLLIIAVRWLSTIETPERIFWSSPWDRHRRMGYLQSEGSSPWGVAALILLLLVLLQYQSTFLDSWFI